MKKQSRRKDIVFTVAVLLLVLVVLYSGLRILESTVLYSSDLDQEKITRKTLVRENGEYFPRQDILTVLILGIDEEGPIASSNSYRNTGEADMVAILNFDQVEQRVTILSLNRDTMLEMPVLGLGGRQAGTYYGQLALSHTYGTGLEDSCENTVKTISDFLYGIDIDYYIAMNMDAIAILNDAVGGVTVNVTEDFSQVDPTITKGRVHLMGDHAVNFVRTRKDVGDQLNLSRIERHKEYIDSFADAFRAKREADPEFMVQAYEDVAPYMVTNCSLNAITSMLDRYGDYSIGEILSPAGENVVGEEYMEFYVDEEKLDELILELFYAAK